MRRILIVLSAMVVCVGRVDGRAGRVGPQGRRRHGPGGRGRRRHRLRAPRDQDGLQVSPGRHRRPARRGRRGPADRRRAVQLRPAERLQPGLQPELGSVQQRQPSGRRRQRVCRQRLLDAGGGGLLHLFRRPGLTPGARLHDQLPGLLQLRRRQPGTWSRSTASAPSRASAAARPAHRRAQWLQADLAAHPNTCTLAYCHIPLFSDERRHRRQRQAALHGPLQRRRRLCSSGHEHIYERFAPDPSGAATHRVPAVHRRDRRRQPHLVTTVPANSETRNSGTFGVLKLTLHPTSYDWQFVPEAGKTFTDSGSPGLPLT